MDDLSVSSTRAVGRSDQRLCDPIDMNTAKHNLQPGDWRNRAAGEALHNGV